jgi:hypothetical protein
LRAGAGGRPREAGAVSRRARLWFLAACALVFALSALWLKAPGSAPPTAQGSAPDARHSTVETRAPGSGVPARFTVADLGGTDELRDRFNADAGVPRLVLVLAPT